MEPQQLGFLVDLSRCVGCRACEKACHHKHPDLPQAFRHVDEWAGDRREQGFLSMSCNH